MRYFYLQTTYNTELYWCIKCGKVFRVWVNKPKPNPRLCMECRTNKEPKRDIIFEEVKKQGEPEFYT